MHSISPPMSSWPAPPSRSLKVNPSPPTTGLLDMQFPPCPTSHSEDGQIRQGLPFDALSHHRFPPSKQCDSGSSIGYPAALDFAHYEASRRRSPKQHQCRRRCSGSKATSVTSRSPSLAASEAPADRLPAACYIFSGSSETCLYPVEEASVADCNVVLEPLQLRRALANLPQSAIGSQRHGPIGANVFVFHIPNEWHEKDLALQFAQFGQLLSARIATDKATGRRLGFGFVSYTNISAACDAVEHLNGHSVAGKRLKVTIKRGEQQHAATFRCDLSTAATPPVLYPHVPPPPCSHQQVCASDTYAGWSSDRLATDFAPDFDPDGRRQLSALYHADANLAGSPFVACERGDEFGFRTNPSLDARSSQQSTNPTASDREDSSASDGSPLRQGVLETASDDQTRMENILNMLLQSGPLGSEANAEQDTRGLSWLETLTVLMQSPDGVRFISSLLQLAQSPATPSEVDVPQAFRFPLTTTSGSGSWENRLFESAGGLDECADQ